MQALTIATDAAVIPTIYWPLCNDLRHLYGHPDISLDALKTLIPQIIQEIFADLILDKVLGNVPIVGIYFNAICAKAFTWRLGTLIAFLASRGPEIPRDSCREAMILIRECFPQRDMFKFQTPDRSRFIELVTAVSALSEHEFSRKVRSAIDALNNA